MPPLLDLTGRRFGRLVALRQDGRNKWGQARWFCQCDCGRTLTVDSHSLSGGDAHSCGCLRRDTMRTIATTHGQCFTPTWQSWRAMIERCTNPNFIGWKYYGGRGITICERWRQSFEHFLADMGERPRGLTLDRLNVNGNYEPSNCRWATRSQQASNRRRAS